MSAATLKQRIWLVTAVASALVVCAPAAQAATRIEGSPDAIDRYLKNRQAQSGLRLQGNRDVQAQSGLRFQGSPDAIDRYLKNRQAQSGLRLQGNRDAQARSDQRFQGSPDAIDRWLKSR